MGRRSTFLLWVFSLTLTADAFFPATSFDCIKNYATQCPDGLCCSVGGVCTQNPGGGSYICCDQRTDGDCGAEDPLGIADIPVPDQPTPAFVPPAVQTDFGGSSGCGIRPDIQCTSADDAWYCPADTPVCGLSYGLCLGSGPACEPEETSSTTDGPLSDSSTAEPSSGDNTEEPHQTGMPETGSSNNDSTPSGGNSDEEPSPTVAETSATSDETIGGSQGIGRTTTAVIVQTPSFPTRPTMVTSAVNPGSGDGGGEAIGESPNPTSTQNAPPSFLTGSPPSTTQIAPRPGTEAPQQPSSGIGTSASQTADASATTRGAATSSTAAQPSSRAVVSKKNALWEWGSPLVAASAILLFWGIW